MGFDGPEHPAIESFMARGLIAEVLHPVKSGKEATVYCCRAGASTGADYLAAKVYRPQAHRGFRNDARYQEGRWYWRRPSHAKRAFDNKSSFGREVQFATWVMHEWATMEDLYEAGVDIPRPVATAEGGILLEFFGTDGRAAEQLCGSSLARGDAQVVLDRVLVNVERMLARHVVHGDLSAYNVLIRPPADIRLIDFPQAVDARFNPSAPELLRRDIANVHRHCARFGAEGDPEAIATDLWRRYTLGEI